MCGLAGVFGQEISKGQVEAMADSLWHRGPDSADCWISDDRRVGLGHTRLRIIDLSASAGQPMQDTTGRWTLVFNGEIYNYQELRTSLSSYEFQTSSDSEVLLAAFATWGLSALDRFLGMFAFLIWDDVEKTLYAVRDRFGVKPLYYAEFGGNHYFASEIKALHAAGVPREPEPNAWAAWLSAGRQDFASSTFWKHVAPLPPGHALVLSQKRAELIQWYSFATQVGTELDPRSEMEVIAEYDALLRESVSLRFRSDVAVGVALSGGLDSATLLAMVNATQGDGSQVAAYTFTSGDPVYDELPWVRRLLHGTNHPHREIQIGPAEVPELATDLYQFADEPYGGIPTIAYAKLCAEARKDGVVVLLGGEGMDEQWAGYDYYADSDSQQVLQATADSPLRPSCLEPDFAALAEQSPSPETQWGDGLRNMQYFDLFVSKIPRTMRYSDRFSMRVGLELREPFLDHRLVELAFRQPANRKIRQGQHKYLLRRISSAYLPQSVLSPPKRPVQTPQREWLRGALNDWCHDMVETAIATYREWLRPDNVRAELARFEQGHSDNSYYVWQWISLGLNATVDNQ